LVQTRYRSGAGYALAIKEGIGIKGSGADAQQARQIGCAQRNLQSAERQFTMAQERRQLSAENLRLAEKAFALGESDLTTLLRIRSAAFDADAFLDRQRVARAAAISRLNQSMGVLP
jgi:outer membrane protein TolC